ncbi:MULTISPECIES: hypothetical protein [Agrobacterium]|nr:hypothetical protein [Agrobacterium rosae]NTE89723.1 hypothetical protein [Agrobacterium rubi]NTF05427.1 hypothetical protein [Agrobacterium rubi]
MASIPDSLSDARPEFGLASDPTVMPDEVARVSSASGRLIAAARQR